MKYKIINSGSDGNATVLEDIILIDCGVSFQKLKNYYKKLKIVLLTHIHGDHFNRATIKKLSKERPTLRFACCHWLINELLDCGVSKKNIDVLKIGISYNYTLFKVMPIKAYHDVPNCGYRIFINNKKVLYITDTGTLEGISAKNYDLYLVEANYDETELSNKINNKIENNVYAYEIRVKNTHLSRKQCIDFFINNSMDTSILIYMHEHKDKEVKNENDRNI